MTLDVINIKKEIWDSAKRLQSGSKEIFKLAKEQAEAEREYRRALALEIMKLKEEKMSVTLIPDVARGNTSELKFNRDLAEAKYTSARESLKAIATQMNGLQSILRTQEEMSD